MAVATLAPPARRHSISRSTRGLARSFFDRPPLEVARELLGKVIVHQLDGVTLAGRIVETEAYLGEGDLAAHAARGMTNRTRVWFGPPGHAYVYFIYGMYECLNLVCESEGTAGSVLIRAVEPLEGIDEMQRRRPKAKRIRDLSSGPGKLTMAMGITRRLNGCDVTRGKFQVRELVEPPPFEMVTATRIGLSVCEDFPFRFYIKDNEFVSVL